MEDVFKLVLIIENAKVNIPIMHAAIPVGAIISIFGWLGSSPIFLNAFSQCLAITFITLLLPTPPPP